MLQIQLVVREADWGLRISSQCLSPLDHAASPNAILFLTHEYAKRNEQVIRDNGQFTRKLMLVTLALLIPDISQKPYPISVFHNPYFFFVKVCYKCSFFVIHVVILQILMLF